MGSTETAFNTHPQPRTFAPSKEDVLQARLLLRCHARAHTSAPLTRRPRSPCAESAILLRSASEPREAQGLLGTPRSHVPLSRCLCAALPSNHRPLAPAALTPPPLKKIPDAGSNTKIRDQLNNLILKSPQNWQTSVALPFFQIEG